jgi:hypothetical protein
MENRIPKEAIEQRTYELYLECGCEGGHDLEHWLAAEEEFTQEQGKRREIIPSKSKGATAVGIRSSKTAV